MEQEDWKEAVRRSQRAVEQSEREQDRTGVGQWFALFTTAAVIFGCGYAAIMLFAMVVSWLA